MTEPFSAADVAFMQKALELARRGRFTTSPNPNVGCLIVSPDTNKVTGAGWHERAGTPHAEVHALQQAGAAAAGSTAYVTLEPCSHFGRTPPCADALAEAGVARVVVAMRDPYHKVAGQGIEKLRQHGISVEVGLLESEARQLNAGFIKRAEQGLPYVRLKLASSLDGRTALANGESKWITGAQARADVQLGRAASSAVLSGAGTVLADNPLLNVRPEQFPAGVVDPNVAVRQPVRVIVDNRAQIHADLKLWQQPGPVWVVRPQGMAGGSQPLPAQGEEIVVPATAEGRVNLTAMAQELARRDINDIWCETGAGLGGALFNAGLVDELILYMAPTLLGPAARPLLELPELTALQQAQCLEITSVGQVGSDIKIVARTGTA